MNPAEDRDSRFEVDPAPAYTCDQSGNLARVFLDHLPQWLKNEIRKDRLSICDWGSGVEAVEPFQMHFPESPITTIDGAAAAVRHAGNEHGAHITTSLPATFDIVAVSSIVLPFFRAPWECLRRLGAHAARHLAAVVPYGGADDAPDHCYIFDDATIATRVDPDFTLSSCKLIRRAESNGTAESRILLTYSRSSFFPPLPEFDDAPDAETGFPDDLSTGLSANESLCRELGRIHALLELRETELRERGRCEAELQSEALHWRNKATEFGQQLERWKIAETELCNSQQRLREEAARLSAAGRNYAAENESIGSRANASAYEAAVLRRSITEIQSSLSWRVTAPLRRLTKPLFRVLSTRAAARRKSQPFSGAAVSQAESAVPMSTAVATPPESAANRVQTILLPRLQAAESVVFVSCALPFSQMLNHRPISFAKYFADRGNTVLFIEIWGTPEEPRHEPGEEVYPGVFAIPVEDMANHLDVVAAAARGKKSYLCTIPVKAVVDLMRPLRSAGYVIHYDIMDDWQEFHRGDSAEWYSFATEREVLALSDTITAVSERLVEKFSHWRSDITVVRNGFDPSALACDQFIAARTPLEGPKTVGYFGHFSEGWFDWETVFHAARKRPEIQFELIGWGLTERPRVRLKEFPNIHFQGLVPQNNLHCYARKWWAAMIPFTPSTLSAAVDPLKIYEYLYLGLNSLVTGITGIAGYPLVHYAEGPEAFVAILDALPDRPAGHALSAAAEFLKECVWEVRLEKLDSMLGAPDNAPSDAD
jgi:hypothetical protein